MERQRIVLLDLEGTLIDEWAFRNFLQHNMQKIKDSGIFDSEGQTVRLGIMSWAVCDTSDAKIFKEDLLPTIEEFFGLKLDPKLPLTMDEYADDIFAGRKLKLSREDLYDMFRKEEVLLTLARTYADFKDSEVWLIDDALSHGLTIHVPERNCTVALLDIDRKLEDWEI